MAETVSHVGHSIANQRSVQKKVTLGTSSNNADVPTGLTTITRVVATPLNGGAYPSFVLNTTIAGSSVAGNVAVKSATSAASYLLEVTGY